MKIRMMYMVVALWFTTTAPLKAQQRQGNKDEDKVYKTTWADGVISAAGVGISYWGLTLMNAKDPLSEDYLQWVAEHPEEAKAKVPKFDRWAAGNFDDRISNLTDIPFYTSFTLPLLFLSHEKTRSDFGQIGLLYLETMAITGSFYTHSAAHIDRYRPLVYNADPDNDDRKDIKATNSFFAGHTAATASATFFAAKVFNDYFPESRAKPFVWAGAALLPLAVGTGRLYAGKHFLSDNIVGYTLGASIGFLVPHLHKISKGKQYSFTPIGGPYSGLAFKMEF